MVKTRIKGHDINIPVIKDSYSRRALKYKNNILSSLRILELTEDDVELELESVAIKNLPASVSWYIEGFHLHFSYGNCKKYVENLFVVSKVIELEINDLIEGKKEFEDFINDFKEEGNVEEERKQARETLGVEHDTKDLNVINKKYKRMSKDLHPDMPNGNVEKFKEINKAHKILKRELEWEFGVVNS